MRTFQGYPAAIADAEQMKNAVATLQTISMMVVAIAAPVSPSMLMKKTLATTLTAALRISRPAAPRLCSVIVMTDNCDRLIREMSIGNPLWEAPRVHGEFLKLGINIGQTSVADYMAKRRHSPSQGTPLSAFMPTASRLWICLPCRQSRCACSMVY